MANHIADNLAFLRRHSKLSQDKMAEALEIKRSSLSAYELGKAGYDCTILEARARVGGRNWTVRKGDEIALTDGSRQVCEFDKGQYFNAGPARLPSHHQVVLGYCRELGVELETETNTSRGALLLNPAVNGGKPIQLRQAVNDTRGHVSELLAKAINRGALDQELTGLDKQKVVEFLKLYGDLKPDLFYRGSERSGLKSLPGAGAEKPIVKAGAKGDRHKTAPA